MKTIVVPLDGSPLAERALPYAAALADSGHARLLLVRAVIAHTFPGTDPGPAQLEAVGRAEASLAESCGRLGAAGLQCEPHVYYDDAAPAILDAAARHHADLIVMSTHGRGGLARAVLGSVADTVLRHAVAPVLLIPRGVRHTWSADRPLRVLLSLDGSKLAEQALASARTLATARPVELALVRVVERTGSPLYGYGHPYIPKDEEQEVAQARRYLHDVADSLAGQFRVSLVSTPVGRAADQILHAAAMAQADLIALATHGRGGLARLVLGSVATHLVQHATVPLLLSRPTALARETERRPAAVPSAIPT